MSVKSTNTSTRKYKITQIKLPISHDLNDLRNKIIHQLRIQPKELVSLEIFKKSIDARKKPQLFYTYTVIVELDKKAKLPKHLSQLETYTEVKYQLPRRLNKAQIQSQQNQTNQKKTHGQPTNPSEHPLPPIIIGTGPAGLFCGYLLALAGLNPILIERGADVDQRIKDVEEFWETGTLNLDSNIQFGEGGAGTFSDGKLNTLVKDKLGRNRFVLETLVEHGAPKEILFEQKPHVGTDHLVNIVKSIRKSIESLGGRIEFNTKLVDILLNHNENGTPANVEFQGLLSESTFQIQESSHLTNDNRATFTRETNTFLNLVTLNPNEPDEPPTIFSTHHLVLAIGHSARDTFEMLHQKNIEMSAKPFAVGLRIEHPQSFINESQYGKQLDYHNLPATSYKLAENLDNGRGVYSFCMCPGGFVVNASSEEGALAINGMSYHARDGQNANSAIVVTVSPDDFPSDHPLSGIEFQRNLERKAFKLGEGKIPVQRLGDFLSGSNVSTTYEKIGFNTTITNELLDSSLLTSTHGYSDQFSGQELLELTPEIKGQWQFANLTPLFPPEIRDALGEGILNMSQKIQGFSHPDALLSGVESRTSSPVRIHRDEQFQSNIKNIYPCGEGAGYAGGITSAAMDGIKVAESIIQNTCPLS